MFFMCFLFLLLLNVGLGSSTPVSALNYQLSSWFWKFQKFNSMICDHGYIFKFSTDHIWGLRDGCFFESFFGLFVGLELSHVLAIVVVVLCHLNLPSLTYLFLGAFRWKGWWCSPGRCIWLKSVSTHPKGIIYLEVRFSVMWVMSTLSKASAVQFSWLPVTL